MTGRKLQHYEVLEKLGEGGMGVVYKARDTRLGRLVALKVLPAEALADPARRARFEQEARAASALNHPHIVTIYDIGRAGDADFIAMEYVAGRTLRSLAGNKGLPRAEALKYAIQIADALAKAHTAGIVHRDIKPDNVMVSDDGQVKVLDFGLAKLTARGDAPDSEVTRSEAAPTKEGAILGTVAYMSPEQAQGKKVDARSDIFSFGAVLYEMLTGSRAFRGETGVATLSAILRDEPRPLGPEVPVDLRRIVERCLRKDLERRAQHMADVKLLLQEVRDEAETGREAPPSRSRSRKPAWIAAALPLAAAGAAAWWALRPAPGKLPPPIMQITRDAGLTTDPALSPDGKLVAYASDRAGEGNLDIWVQQVTGGEPIRLTRDPGDEREPCFSPDGSRIVYRAERDGGGLYQISTLGGEATLLAPQGRSPRFSPDGSQIGYWTGRLGTHFGKLFVIPASGGAPRGIPTQSATAGFPIWSPDGKWILYQTTANPIQAWVVPSAGGTAIRTELFQQLGETHRFGFNWDNYPTVRAWEPGNLLILSARRGDGRNVWRVPFSPRSWSITGVPQAVTTGAATALQASAGPGGQVVFASLTLGYDIWGLPLDANRAATAGSLTRLTSDAAVHESPSVSADGALLAFSSNRFGNRDVWVKNLTTGKETPLTNTPAQELGPYIRGDGAYVAFRVPREGRQTGRIIPVGGGVAETVCDNCIPRFWSPDSRFILATSQIDGRAAVVLLDPRSRRHSPLLRQPEHHLWQASFAPDGRWISFNAELGPGRSRLYVAPFRSGQVPENEWITISDQGWDDKPRWSPDGNLLYLLSDRDGFFCIWVQPLEGATKRPKGEALPVYHSHSARRSIAAVELGQLEISVARDKIVFIMGEAAGNVWMTTLP